MNSQSFGDLGNRKKSLLEQLHEVERVQEGRHYLWRVTLKLENLRGLYYWRFLGVKNHGHCGLMETEAQVFP